MPTCSECSRAMLVAIGARPLCWRCDLVKHHLRCAGCGELAIRYELHDASAPNCQVKVGRDPCPLCGDTSHYTDGLAFEEANDDVLYLASCHACDEYMKTLHWHAGERSWRVTMCSACYAVADDANLAVRETAGA